MRLIDADSLKFESETCLETTSAFQQLIDKQPTAIENDIFNMLDSGALMMYKTKHSVAYNKEWLLHHLESEINELKAERGSDDL